MSPLGEGASWPRAAVFDCDGLLVDSAACWEQAYARVAERHGKTLADVDLDSLAGASVAIAAEALSRSLGVSVAERALREALRDSFAAVSPAPLPGVRRMVNGLAASIPLAVASNGPLDVVTDVLRQIGILRCFQTVVSAEETLAHKPAPDVYLEACRRLGVAAQDAIAFEDSPAGAAAARSAGMLVIAVPFAPGARIDSDLTVPRLDDPRLVRYLGLEAALDGDGRQPTPAAGA